MGEFKIGENVEASTSEIPSGGDKEKIIKALRNLPIPRGADFPTQRFSNEQCLRPFAEAIEGVKGAYLGVGVEQNFSLIAAAKPELAIIVDRGSDSIEALQAHRLVHLHVPSAQEYYNFWYVKGTEDKDKQMEKWDLTDKEKSFFWNTASDSGLIDSVRACRKVFPNEPYGYSWLANEKDFTFVKEMFLKDKIIIVQADLQDEKIYSLMGKLATNRNLVFNTLYISNVEDHLGGKLYYGSKTRGFLDDFWKNLASLPTGKDALILRTMGTIASRSLVTLSSDAFHYVIQQVSDFRERIKSWKSSYTNFVFDVARHITEKSPAVTRMPVPENERDGFVGKLGAEKFPFRF